MDLHSLRPLLDRLVSRGDARVDENWAQRKPDLVREYGLTLADVSDLLSIAKLRADSDNLSEDGEHWAIASIHAWRALAQLGATDAVQPLLDMQAALTANKDGWYEEEFPLVFGLIGPAAIPAVAEYMTDATHPEAARCAACLGLLEIAERNSESRTHVVDILTGELAPKLSGQEWLNANLVRCLLRLNAVESADVIERAFAANVVDNFIYSGWDEVRKDLALRELSLLPDDQFAARFRDVGSILSDRSESQQLPDQRDRQKLVKDRAKAKRKQQNRSRSRNRRSK